MVISLVIVVLSSPGSREVRSELGPISGAFATIQRSGESLGDKNDCGGRGNRGGGSCLPRLDLRDTWKYRFRCAVSPMPILDDDGDLLTAVLVDRPSNGSLNIADDGSSTYTPNPDFNGTDTLTYRASDGTSQSNLASVTINVTPSPDPPTAVDDQAIEGFEMMDLFLSNSKTR